METFRDAIRHSIIAMDMKNDVQNQLSKQKRILKEYQEIPNWKK